MIVQKKDFDEKLFTHLLGYKSFKSHIIVLILKDFIEIYLVLLESQKIK